jgi:hypothetical protein
MIQVYLIIFRKIFLPFPPLKWNGPFFSALQVPHVVKWNELYAVSIEQIKNQIHYIIVIILYSFHYIIFILDNPTSNGRVSVQIKVTTSLWWANEKMCWKNNLIWKLEFCWENNLFNFLFYTWKTGIKSRVQTDTADSQWRFS